MTQKFSYDWFSPHKQFWDAIIPSLTPKKILEVGSFEGKSTCYIIEECSKYNPIDLYCIDTWEGSLEHTNWKELNTFENAFHHNVNVSIRNSKNPVTLHKRKGKSAKELPKLIAEGVGGFDLIYIDGSHMAPDVLVDACYCFNLLRLEGVLIFDDYLWAGWGDMNEDDLYKLQETMQHPKPAIDAFMEIFRNKLSRIIVDSNNNVLETYQMYLQKKMEL